MLHASKNELEANRLDVIDAHGQICHDLQNWDTSQYEYSVVIRGHSHPP